MDTTLLASVLSFLSCMSSVLWSLVVVVVVSPVMLAMLAPLSVCYYYLQVSMVACVCTVCMWGGDCTLASMRCPMQAPSVRACSTTSTTVQVYMWLLCVCVCVQTRYVRSSREIKRLDSLALSPIFTHFSETLQARPGQGQGGAWLDGGRGCSGCSSARAVALAAQVHSTACLRDLSMGACWACQLCVAFKHV